MCGIIGYTGTEGAIPKITEGLSRLEYRGYDSVGIAMVEDNRIKTVKCRGRIHDLKGREELIHSGANCAVGHTRWATHGCPSDVNAHPHRAGRVVLVHNGIVENYRELRRELEKRGSTFSSETDTEVAAAFLDVCYEKSGEPLAAIREMCASLRGSYAFGILFDDRVGEIYAVRKGSPLIIAKGEDGYYLASDMTALLRFSKEYISLEEGESACLQKDSVSVFYADGVKKDLSWKMCEMSAESAERGGYAHFMQKEIFEQPKAIFNSVSTRIQDGMPDFSSDGIDDSFWRAVKNVQIVACGSAMHAGLLGARLIEGTALLPTTVHIASEYRYYPPIASEGTLTVVISQSGETADTLAALRHAKEMGLPTLAIVNAVGTTIAREADYCIYTYAGPEIAVATTKGYCTQLSVLCMISAVLAKVRGSIGVSKIRELVHAVSVEAPHAMEKILNEKKEQIQRISRALSSAQNAFYIGRGADFALSMEAALKLKEISYIHAEAYAAGELKHGTISLVEEGTPVFAICTEKRTDAKMESNVREVEGRGGRIILICREDMRAEHSEAWETVTVPSGSDLSSLFSALAIVQMIAYEISLVRGCDIDKPRNLAKSVTVE